MKTSTNWLKTYIDIPWAPRELAERLTLAGLEVEGIDELGALPESVVVGEILARTPHPNADSLSVCSVDVGAETPLQIVCGAPNCDAGVKAPVALIGTKLDSGLKIKKTKLRGIASEGMLCARDELGLGADHSGLMLLPADAPVGAPLADVLQADTVIDWEVTPNRPDWLCHIGIAREIAAVCRQPEALRLPATDYAADHSVAIDELTAVEVQDPDLCPRYLARVIRDVTIAPSPQWLQEALRAVGVRPINNVVDITNFVMLECGQPLHAFDYHQLAEQRIVVRRAKPGETMMTLDGETRTLTPDNLLICDAERAVALAGVMGGQNSEISPATTTVLLESAVFAPTNIRSTAKTLGLNTESSHRFERGVDIGMTDFASRRAAALMAELAGGRVVADAIDVYAEPYAAPGVSCRCQRVRELLGVAIPATEIVSCLNALGLEVTARDEERVSVSIPSFRPDLQREVDLIEEVARLYGLNNIPAAAERAQVGGDRASDQYYALEEARAQLRALGLNETMTYSFINPEAAISGSGCSEDNLIRPTNPLSRELGAMRPSLVPGVLQTASHNIAHNQHDLQFFELGRVLTSAPDMPEERYQVAIVMSGRRMPERFGPEKETELDLFDVKGVLEGWFAARRLSPVCEAAQHPSFLPGTCGRLALDNTPVAWFGQATPELTADLRLKHPLFLAIIELEPVLSRATPPLSYTPLPQFPAVVRDISFVGPADLSNKAVLDLVHDTGIAEIESVELFDIYSDEDALGPGRASRAYSITYRDAAKTLTDAKVNALHERVRKQLAETLNVELR